MSTTHSKTTESGFTLVEIMIGLAILSVAVLGMMKLFENFNMGTRTTQMQNDLLEFHKEVTAFLAQPSNCKESFQTKQVNGELSALYKIVDDKLTPMYTVGKEIRNTGIKLDKIKVLSTDFNGSDGSRSKIVVEVTYDKRFDQSTGGQGPRQAFGGKTIKKLINLTGSLCSESIKDSGSLATLKADCQGSNKKVLQGPFSWVQTDKSTLYWLECQDCSGASKSSYIASCSSTGSDSGIDILNLAKIRCLEMGGTFDEADQQCEFDEQKITDYIQDKIDDLKDSLPNTVLIADSAITTCSGLYSKDAGNATLSVDFNGIYRTCVTKYKNPPPLPGYKKSLEYTCDCDGSGCSCSGPMKKPFLREVSCSDTGTRSYSSNQEFKRCSKG